MITYENHIHFKLFGPKNSLGQYTHSLELKGTGCREAEYLGIDWEEFFKYVHEHNLSVSTLHIAADVFTNKYFTMDELIKKSRKKEYVCSFRKYREVNGRINNDQTGTSLYYGSRDGNQINIYDKKNERYHKGYEVDTNYWIRIEIRLKSKANDFVRLFNAYGLKGFPTLYFGVLNGLLEFKSDRGSSRIKRRKTWYKWKKFIDQVDKIQVSNQYKVEQTISRRMKWFKRSVGKTHLLIQASCNYEQYIEYNNAIVDEQVPKLTYKDLATVNNKRIENGLDMFEDINDLKEHLLKIVTEKNKVDTMLDER
jgi:phage replication initiation protein